MSGKIPGVKLPEQSVVQYMKLKPVAPFTSLNGETRGMSDTLVGVELEIENFPHEIHWEFPGMTFTEDGSLRNDGKECITRPMAMKYYPTYLAAFFKHFKITDRNYSERCSTHVHVNVQDMTLSQVGTVLLLYQTVERLLFNFIGNNRQNNIFCVPWHQSGLTYTLIDALLRSGATTARAWHKYSALNLIPMTSLGTLEFRHLHGTCDVGQIANWLKILDKIFQYAKTHSQDAAKDAIVNMNTVSNYREWLYNIFDEQADLLATNAAFEGELSLGVIDAKLMLTKPPANPYKNLIIHNDQIFDDDLAQDFVEPDDQEEPAEPLPAPLQPPRRFAPLNAAVHHDGHLPQEINWAANPAERAAPRAALHEQWGAIDWQAPVGGDMDAQIAVIPRRQGERNIMVEAEQAQRARRRIVTNRIRGT